MLSPSPIEFFDFTVLTDEIRYLRAMNTVPCMSFLHIFG